MSASTHSVNVGLSSKRLVSQRVLETSLLWGPVQSSFCLHDEIVYRSREPAPANPTHSFDFGSLGLIVLMCLEARLDTFDKDDTGHIDVSCSLRWEFLTVSRRAVRMCWGVSRLSERG